MAEDDDRSYQVVVNVEEQYSIWPIGKEIPPGWKPTGETGSKAACLSYIARGWGNMTPRSLPNLESELTRVRSRGKESKYVSSAIASQKPDPMMAEEDEHDTFDPNNYFKNSPGNLTVQQLFEHQAHRHADAAAIVYGQQRLTYGQLNAKSNQVASYLRRLGIGREKLVAICMERGIEMVVGLLGILKAGGGYVPLDPRYPAARLSYIIEDTAASIVLTQKHLKQLLPDGNYRRVILEVDDVEISSQPEHNLMPTSGPQNLAYVMYTSGSTGTPKGVQVENRCIVSLVSDIDYVEISSGDMVAQASAITFDAATFEIWAALCNGATLVGLEKQTLMSPDLLRQQAEKYSFRALFVTTALFNQLVNVDPGIFQSIGTLLFGGEKVDSKSVARVLQSGRGPRRLLHVYGPTETTTFASWHLVDKVDPKVTVPIGRPITNTYIYILGPALEPVLPGVPGEIYIGGSGVARGYLNRPDFTAEHFLPDPFRRLPGARMYRSGDLARFLPDGNIEFIGRSDDQVKIRGFRVELGEIEANLLKHQNVSEAATLLREDTPGDKRLVGYVVTRGRRPSLPQLREFLTQRLPDFMIPSSIVSLREMPLTIEGKIDRGALPPPPHKRSELERPYVAPGTNIEQILARIWAEVLGIDRVGIDDNFFELGGDSLAAARVAWQLQESFRSNIYVAGILQYPVLKEYAFFLDAGFAAKEEARPVGVGDKRELIERVRLAGSRLRGEGCSGEPVAEPTAIILSAPRSGSTLLRAMLAGHRLLFAPPELELLQFQTLRERSARLSGAYSWLQDGLVRAVMQLWKLSAGEARDLISQFVDSGESVRDFYLRLIEKSGERILVEKSTTYALDPETITNQIRLFPKCKIIHLVRNPASVADSFTAASLVSIYFRELGSWFSQWNAKEVGEAVWLVCNTNISSLLEPIEERVLPLRFEDLVTDPRSSMKRVLSFVGVDWDDATLNPYDNLPERMLDGIYPDPAARMLGDPNFLNHKTILKEKGQQQVERHTVTELTYCFALNLGYNSITSEAWHIPRLNREHYVQRTFRGDES